MRAILEISVLAVYSYTVIDCLGLRAGLRYQKKNLFELAT